MEDDLRKSLITQLKSSFDGELPDVNVEPSLESAGSYVNIGDLVVSRNDIIEAIDYFTTASTKLSATLEPSKMKRANYCMIANAALSYLLTKRL